MELAENQTQTEIQGHNTLGTVLKKLRESKSISLHAMSEHTKIRLHHLQAIEASNTGDELALPSAYYRGYTKTYAGYMGLDLSEYQHELDSLYPLESGFDQQNQTTVYNTAHISDASSYNKLFAILGLCLVLATAYSVRSHKSLSQLNNIPEATKGNLMDNPATILQSEELH